MTFFLMVTGPMDAVSVGPFDKRADADKACAAVPADRFDACVITDAELTANVAEFGNLELTAPADVDWE